MYNLKMSIVGFEIINARSSGDINTIYGDVYPDMKFGDVRAMFNSAFPDFIKKNYPDAHYRCFLNALDGVSESLIPLISDFTKSKEFHILYDGALFQSRIQHPKCVVTIRVE
jgi:hypothetical protein